MASHFTPAADKYILSQHKDGNIFEFTKYDLRSTILPLAPKGEM
jgi:hypothetical protein